MKNSNKKVTVGKTATGKVGGTNASTSTTKKPGGKVGGSNKKQTVSPQKLKMGGSTKSC